MECTMTDKSPGLGGQPQAISGREPGLAKEWAKYDPLWDNRKESVARNSLNLRDALLLAIEEIKRQIEEAEHHD